MQATPLVAIVILNYNGKHYLQKFLPSVTASAYRNKKVVVADNSSTDDSLAWLKGNYPQVEIVVNETNYGYAKGYNEALKHVKADYYVLLNSDVEVTENWIAPVVELMETNPQIACCQPKILAYNNKNLFEYAGACGGWIDKFGYPFCRGRVFDICEKDKRQYNDVAPVFWASGAALFIRSAVYHQLKGFDEYFFAHQEEIDLCWRLQLAGYRVMVCPQSVVYHVGGGTLPKGRRKVYLNLRNNLIMLAKNYPFKEKIWKIPFRILLDILAAFQGLLSGETAFFGGVIKAHASFAAWIFSNKKANVFPASRIGKPVGYYNGSVVWQYFIRKKKTFKEIIEKP